jgi:uncharacterized protein YciI
MKGDKAMAHYIVEYADSGDAETREQHRAEHISYRIGMGEDMLLAGPLLSDDEATAIGSLVLIRAENAHQARQLALADPLVKAGVLSLVSLRPYRVAAILGTRPQ